jgi:cell division transport system ATP-binding protein
VAFNRKKSKPFEGDTVVLDGISLRYDDGPVVLRALNLALPQRSFHFLTGPSGAGKTSLLSLLYLARRPVDGTLRLFGEDVTRASRGRLATLRRRLGVVFQDFRLLDHLSAFDNVALPLRIAKVAEDVVTQDVGELLRWVGLAEHIDSPPAVLSGGQKQRVAIARAVVNRPKLILADEPTGNLDEGSGDGVIDLLLALCSEEGCALVLVTHNAAHAGRCGRKLFLREGGFHAV